MDQEKNVSSTLKIASQDTSMTEMENNASPTMETVSNSLEAISWMDPILNALKMSKTASKATFLTTAQTPAAFPTLRTASRVISMMEVDLIASIMFQTASAPISTTESGQPAFQTPKTVLRDGLMMAQEHSVSMIHIFVYRDISTMAVINPASQTPITVYRDGRGISQDKVVSLHPDFYFKLPNMTIMINKRQKRNHSRNPILEPNTLPIRGDFYPFTYLFI